MSRRAMEGRMLSRLLRHAMVVCIQAEAKFPRTGPGRKPEIADWVIATMITLSIARQKKSKSSQYRYLHSNRQLILRQLGVDRFPCRSTFFARYRRASRIFQYAILCQGRMAIRYGWCDARVVSVDKSVIASRGPQWHQRYVEKEGFPRGADREARWTKTSHDGWVLGYAYEIVVTSPRKGVVWPILASATTANVQEQKTFAEKLPDIPPQTRYVLADKGYDSDDFGDFLEWNGNQRRTGRRFLCPLIDRTIRRPKQQWKRSKQRIQRKRHREKRRKFLESVRGQRLYARRSKTVEPINEWLKSLFDLHDKVWHYGLENNRTQILAAIFVYQILLRINHELNRNNGKVKWIIDQL